MTSQLRRLFAATALTFAVSAAHADNIFTNTLSAVADTLPSGITSSSFREKGFFSSTWQGIKLITGEGTTGLILPSYTVHPAWDYDNRRQENGLTWGGGISRRIIDERGNERLIYAMAFSDSHNNFEPVIGYAWLARWPLGSTGLHVSTGYTLGVTFRSDYQWLPIPIPLPIAGVGTDNFNLYGAFIPFSNVFFFFAKMDFDDRKKRSLPFNSAELFGNRHLIYAGGGWQKTDMNGRDGMTISSDGAYTLGYRLFLDRHWAFDVAATRSKHDLYNYGSGIGDYKLTGYTATAQYHFEATSNLRLYAGLGLGYWRADSLRLNDGWHMEKGSLGMVIQSGATYAVTKNIHVTGGLDMGFARFKTNIDGESGEFYARPSPATFKMTVGFAF